MKSVHFQNTITGRRWGLRCNTISYSLGRLIRITDNLVLKSNVTDAAAYSGMGTRPNRGGATSLNVFSCKIKMERSIGFEPIHPVWKTSVLPLTPASLKKMVGASRIELDTLASETSRRPSTYAPPLLWGDGSVLVRRTAVHSRVP